jgi:hypothetical protein
MPKPIVPLFAVCLSACAANTAQSPYPLRSFAEDFVCRETGLPQFVGKEPTQDVATQMLTVSGAKDLRWVPHGGVMTMDKRTDRVTAQLDAQGRIAWARCV